MTVLVAFVMVILMAVTALAVDYGYLLVVRGQIQSAVDAAALAGAVELVDDEALTPYAGMADETALARQKAIEYAALNHAASGSVSLDPNDLNDPAGDVVVGYVVSPFAGQGELVTGTYHAPNAVKVMGRLTEARSSSVGLFFARVLGLDSGDVSASATACRLAGIKGFKVTDNTGNAGLLPFAIWEQDWQNLLAGAGGDHFAYDETTGSVSTGNDGIQELRLYPLDLFSGEPGGGAGEPAPSGNFGTVDIGGLDNSTAVIARQITDGVTAEDLAYHGGSLEFNASGILELQGDTGISASVKDDIQAILGEARTIPLYRTVSQSGNNATYQIVKFVGIRIMDVKLTGALKHRGITIQPAIVTDATAISSVEETYSQYVQGPPVLVR